MSEDADDFSVAAQARIAARDRARERSNAKRARRDRILLWLCAPFLLPAAGAAAALAVIDGRDLSSWSSAAVALFTAAAFGLPAALSAWLARRRGRIEPLGWAAITLLMEIALVFWVGLVALGYGPE
jgi:cation transport ATPase